MRVGIWSLFRDDAGPNIEAYRRRVSSLDYPPELLRFYLVEGDSKDNTFAELQAWAAEDSRVTVVQHLTGTPRMRHTPHRDRLKCLGDTGNAAVEALCRDRWAGYGMLVESDLIYEPDIIFRLLRSKPADAQVYSPFIWIPGKGDHLQFYDVWAFRTLDGEMFKPYRPAWYETHLPQAPFEVHSVGSMVLIDADLLYRGIRFTDRAIVGMCEEAKKLGAKVYADPTTSIFHPPVLNPFPLVEK